MTVTLQVQDGQLKVVKTIIEYLDKNDVCKQATGIKLGYDAYGEVWIRTAKGRKLKGMYVGETL